MYPEFKKNELILFLFLLIAGSVIFIDKTQAKAVFILSLAGLFFNEQLLEILNNPKSKKNKNANVKKLCAGPTEQDLEELPSDPPVEMPEDPFNTYKDDYLSNKEYDRITYRSFAEYPEDVAKHINPVYDQRNYMTSADDKAAQMSRTCQMRAKEATDIRARYNINSIRPYMEEDLVSTENAPWWGDNDQFFM